MHFVVALRRDHRAHQPVSFFVRAPFANQPKPSSYAKDMCIEWEDRSVAGEQKRTSYGLGPDTFKTCRKPPGFIERRASEKRQIKRPATLVNLIQQLFYSHRFLFGESA